MPPGTATADARATGRETSCCVTDPHETGDGFPDDASTRKVRDDHAFPSGVDAFPPDQTPPDPGASYPVHPVIPSPLFIRSGVRGVV